VKQDTLQLIEQGVEQADSKFRSELVVTMELGKDKKEAFVQNEGGREILVEKDREISFQEGAALHKEDANITLQNLDDKIVLDVRGEVLLEKLCRTGFRRGSGS
jgi:hypothetical protein